jgi:hypothetical protein
MKEQIQTIVSMVWNAGYAEANYEYGAKKITPKKATEAILTLFEEVIPNDYDTEGSSGKWVNGWNDALQHLRDKIRGER